MNPSELNLDFGHKFCPQEFYVGHLESGFGSLGVNNKSLGIVCIPLRVDFVS